MYQLTINAPLEKGYSHEHIVEIIRSNFKTVIYFCMADEQGTMFHTHIFIVFSSRVRFSMVKRYFSEAHIERCKGKRHDMSELYQMVLDNMTNAEILAVNQDYILQIDKLDKVRTTILTERFKETVRLDLEVTYISGATGTGKTRGVLESNGYSNVYRVTDYLHPFDGYACQSVICFDEFRASLKLKEMLMYCDIYPIELPSRYANKFACYNKVYIVSNWALEKQYPEIQREDKESWQAFLRRIHKVICYDDSGEKTEYQSVEDYFSRNEDFVLYTGMDLPFDE